MTDCEIILKILSDGEWHNIIEICYRGKPQAINWAVRSRISNLKQKGYNIISKIGKNRQGEYRLITEKQMRLFV